MIDDIAKIVQELREDARGTMAYHELSDRAADVIEHLFAETIELKRVVTVLNDENNELHLAVLGDKK